MEVARFLRPEGVCVAFRLFPESRCGKVCLRANAQFPEPSAAVGEDGKLSMPVGAGKLGPNVCTLASFLNKGGPASSSEEPAVS